MTKVDFSGGIASLTISILLAALAVFFTTNFNSQVVG